jgi:hypothetical protein
MNEYQLAHLHTSVGRLQLAILRLQLRSAFGLVVNPLSFS